MSQTIDLTGLPEPVIENIQKLVATFRPDSGAGDAVAGGSESADEWVARWRAWCNGHAVHAIAMDDSRESIYAGRGE